MNNPGFQPGDRIKAEKIGAQSKLFENEKLPAPKTRNIVWIENSNRD